jgi:hypothetical protein
MLVDIETLYGYCKKYKISQANAKRIAKALVDQKPELFTHTDKYSWGEVETAAYIVTVEGRKIRVEMSNYMKYQMTNVTCIVIDGVNGKV